MKFTRCTPHPHFTHRRYWRPIQANTDDLPVKGIIMPHRRFAERCYDNNRIYAIGIIFILRASTIQWGLYHPQWRLYRKTLDKNHR